MDAQPEAIPVIRMVRGRPRSYLEVITQGKSVRVQPVNNDQGRALNRFWTVWLRYIILEKSDARHTYGVALRDNAVIVTSSATQEGLAYTVAMLAQEIRPIRQAQLHRLHDTGEHHGVLAWEYGGSEWGEKERQAAASLVLPQGAEMNILDWDGQRPCRVELRCSWQCALSAADVGKIVELHFALCLGS